MTMQATTSAISANTRMNVVNCRVKCTAALASDVASWLPVCTW